MGRTLLEGYRNRLTDVAEILAARSHCLRVGDVRTWTEERDRKSVV